MAMGKYVNAMVALVLISVSSVLAQANKMPGVVPSEINKRIETPAHIFKDSAVILLNNKFYRLSELNEYNYTIDGISIQSLDVVRDKDVITKILSDKISVLVIVNAPGNQRADSVKSQKKN